MRVKFRYNYDHTYPSGAMQYFPAGYEGTIKREVGDAAVIIGVAEEIADVPGDTGPNAPEVVRDVAVQDTPPAVEHAPVVEHAPAADVIAAMPTLAPAA